MFVKESSGRVESMWPLISCGAVLMVRQLKLKGEGYGDSSRV